MKTKHFAILFLFMASSALAAGTEGGGGGIVFVCGQNSSSPHVFLADTYLLENSENSTFWKEMKDVSDEYQAQKAISASIAKVDPATATEIEENLKALRFVPEEQSLPLLGDDDITADDIPPGCVKTQLARQDFATDTVHYDRSLYASLRHVEQALFTLHEAYVRKYRSNSSVVRTHVADEASSSTFRTLLQKSFSSEDEFIVFSGYHDWFNSFMNWINGVTTIDDQQRESIVQAMVKALNGRKISLQVEVDAECNGDNVIDTFQPMFVQRNSFDWSTPEVCTKSVTLEYAGIDDLGDLDFNGHFVGQAADAPHQTIVADRRVHLQAVNLAAADCSLETFNLAVDTSGSDGYVVGLRYIDLSPSDNPNGQTFDDRLSFRGWDYLQSGPEMGDVAQAWQEEFVSQGICKPH